MGSLNVAELMKNMTLEEKASLCSGADFWHTNAVERLGLPDIMVSDGPHGLRKQTELTDHMGVAQSVEAVCFPTASAMACSFDRDLLHEVGNALGDECQAEDVAVLLGPGANMKRSPLCGRNFEYYSEDPYLAGELGASFVNGVQEKQIGTSVKHFAANNQETRRLTINAIIDERTLREIYLAGYERIVKKAQPWTMMCSYNRINGVYSCENEWLNNQVLRKEWGFQGLIMTDWGAMNERVSALMAGMDLEMPSCHGETDKQIVAAVQNGSLDIAILDKTVERVLTLVDRYLSHKQDNAVYDQDAHHQLAKKVAENSAVLLKNAGILPLKEETKVAVIGEFARVPRIQGGGSSHINCFRIDSALDALAQNSNISFAPGYELKNDQIHAELEQEAIKLAKEAEVAVIFAGLPDAFESEGFDRTHLRMPDCQNHLIEEICKVQPNTVVVLHNGSPIQMPWLAQVKGVLEMYLSGQASGSAAVDLLYGKVNPSGKLAETFPLRLEDNPSYLNFPGTREEVHYQEGIFIGYRYYDKKNMGVLFPFGYGQSYTTFQYSHARLLINGEQMAPPVSCKDTAQIQLQLEVTNTGAMAGAEVVQLYIKNSACDAIRPEKELKDFVKVFLQPGETKTISMTLNQRSFAYYNVDFGDWYIPSGAYEILVGSSSRDIHCYKKIFIEGSVKIPYTVTGLSTCADIKLHCKNTEPLEAMLRKSGFGQPADPSDQDSMGDGTTGLMEAMFADTPLHAIISFSGEELTIDDIQHTIEELNRLNH